MLPADLAAHIPMTLVEARLWMLSAHSLLNKTFRQRPSAELVEKPAIAFAAGFPMPADGVLDQFRVRGKGQPSRQAQFVYSVATDLNEGADILPLTGSQVITFQDGGPVATEPKLRFSPHRQCFGGRAAA